MENQIAVQQPQRSQITMPVVNLNEVDIKRHIAPTATDKELYMFMEICRSYGLNPFKREVHFVKYGNGPGSTIVGYETYIKRAERTMLLDGWNVELGKDDLGEKAIITIYRKDQSKPFVWTVYRHEFDEKKANWLKMPLFMLRKVAISQGFRLAFPEELGGMPYIPEEINGRTSDELPKGNVIEGEFTSPAGMDQMPGQEGGYGPDPINVEMFTKAVSMMSLDDLKAEWEDEDFQLRYGVSDKKAIKAAFDARIAELTTGKKAA